MYTRDQVYQQTLEYFKGDTLATDVWINKYCLKNMRGELMELTPDDMHRRIASEFARIESTFDNPIDETEVYNLIKDFRFIIPQGSPMSGIGNEQQVISLANCFVVGNGQDSYGGILNTEEQMVHLMKRRGGVGTDLSHIRPRGFAVNNAAISSAGVAPFMERYSNATREVAQDGRRGALMLTMSDRSENFEDFIDAKLETTRVTGANISVKLSDEFMVAAINDTEFEQRFPYNSDKPTHSQNVSAKKLWKKLIHNSWKSAEPGILFWDKIINESPADCYKDFGFSTVSTNPCVVGETMIFTNMGWIQIKNLEHWQSVYPELTIVTRDDKGTLTNSKLEWVGITKEQDEIFRIIFENDTELLTNKTHKLYFPDYTEVSVEELSNIAKPVAVIGADGLVNVLSVEPINETRDVWDLTANPNYNFFSVMDVRPGIVSAAIITVNENIKFQCYDVITLNKGVQKFAYELAKNDRFADGTIVEKLENMYCKPETISNYFKRSILNVDCGEIPLCPTDSCRLIAINLYSFVNDPFTEIAEFDFNKFTQVVGVAQRLMDDLVELEKEKIDTIIQKIASDPEIREIKQCELDLWNRVKTTLIHGRRTGLGITAEGDMLAALGIRYGTDKATDFCENVHQTMAVAAFRSSVNLAKERGAFPIWCYELEKDNPFINRLLAADPSINADYQQFGRRNIAMLTIAPTGSVSLLTQTTSGIEPLFMPYYTRRRKINPNDRDAKTSFIDAVGDHWEEYKVFHNKLLLWGNINGHQLENMNHHALDDIIEKSPYYLATANDINWQEKVRMQGLIQQWCDHSISSCVVADTLIETDSGLFYIDELADFKEIKENTFKKNDEVKIKVLNHESVFSDISSFYNNGIKDTFKMTLENGLFIICTSNEKFISSKNEWIELSDLKIGDEVKINN